MTSAASNGSLAGQTILVTGATSGIGRSAAQSLAQRGARVVIVGRSPEKTAAAVAAIQQGTGNQAITQGEAPSFGGQSIIVTG